MRKKWGTPLLGIPTNSRLYIYIYTYRERERERDIYIYTCLDVYPYVGNPEVRMRKDASERAVSAGLLLGAISLRCQCEAPG